MRAFLCMPLPEATRSTIHGVAESLRSRALFRARWVPESNYHITLRFLGDINPMLTVEIDRRMRRIAQSSAPFICAIDRLGAFPDINHARVVWAGGKALPEHESLCMDVGQALISLGFPPLRIDQGIHITLARLKDRPQPGLSQALSDLTPRPPVRVDVHHMALMQSTLTPRGAQYETLRTWSLGQDRDDH